MTITRIKQLYPKTRRVPASAVELVQIRESIDHMDRQMLVEMIEVRRRPSTITDYNGDLEFRTSETRDLFPSDPLIAARDHDDITQGKRYLSGQEFKPRTECFE